MKMRYFFATLSLVAICCCLGCNNGGITRCSVDGTLTIGGEPVETGSVTFHPIEGTESPTAGASVVGGKFTVLKDKGPAPGKFQLEIAATKDTGNKIAGPGGIELDETINLVDSKYAYPSGEEIQTIELKAGKNKIDLNLDAPKAE